MRLWDETLLKYLPKQILMGQHRECCALRGKGWNKNHSTVQYALDDDMEKLIAYHNKVIKICVEKHDINISKEWCNFRYRGKQLGYDNTLDLVKVRQYRNRTHKNSVIYDKHNGKYTIECLDNLFGKMIGVIKRYNGEVYSDKYRNQLWDMFNKNFQWYLDDIVEMYIHN